MDAMLEKYNFAAGTSDTESQLTDELQQFDNMYKQSGISKEEAKRIVAVFSKKACVKNFPPRMSPGYYMCSGTARYLEDILGYCQEFTPEEKNKLRLELLIDFLSKGRGTAHYEVINENYMYDPEYIEQLRGPDLKRLFDAIVQEEYIEEEGIDEKEWSSCFLSALKGLTAHAVGGKKNMEKCLEPETMAIVLDYYMNLAVLMLKNPSLVVDTLAYGQRIIKDKFKYKPYNSCNDVELFKRHFKIMKELLTNPEFPRFDSDKKYVAETAYVLIHGVLRNKPDKIMKEPDKVAAFDRDHEVVLTGTWDTMTDFITSLILGPQAHKLPEVIMEYHFIARVVHKEPNFVKHPELFESWAPKVAEILEKFKDLDLLEKMISGQDLVNNMLVMTEQKAGYDKYWIPILEHLMRIPTIKTALQARELVNETKLKKVWNWKKNVEKAKEILIKAKDIELPAKKDDHYEWQDEYGNAIWYLFKLLKIAKIKHLAMPELAELTITFMERKSEVLYHVIQRYQEWLDFTENKDVIPKFLKRFLALYKDSEFHISNTWSGRVTKEMMRKIIGAYKDGNDIPKTVNDMLTAIFDFAMEDDTVRVMDDDEGEEVLTLYGDTMAGILTLFIQKHSESNTTEKTYQALPGLPKRMEDLNEGISKEAKMQFALLSKKDPEKIAVSESFDVIIKKYIQTGDSDMLYALYTSGPSNMEPLLKDFQEIFSTLIKDNDNVFMCVAFLYLISEKEVKVFTKDHVAKINKYLDNKECQGYVLMIWSKILLKNPDYLLNQMDTIMNVKDMQMTNMNYVQQIFGSMAVKYEKFVQPVMKYFIEKTKVEDKTYVAPLIYGMRKIADNFGAEPFKPYRKYLDQLRKTSDYHIKDPLTLLIDTLEGRSLETVSTDVKKVQEDVDELDERVTDTEVVIGGVVQQVERHEDDINDVKGEVGNVKQRVGAVEEDLEEVKEQVEEIDMKTMSNAPTWSRDVTKLLNPESDHDWRLLASRLGYTNDDIRAWATQSDPCMALLSEWYATHSTREATSGVLNILQEMNRMDAAVIVENAMKTAEDVVEDEDFEYPSPPPVFLSYQWGHQNKVKLLRQHLEMAGYTCWMDVGQMGGGDKLFEKIDSGIRAAKVVICCVSEKYAKSPNCNREVNLAVNLKKPMIPLQMEKIAWPPVGSMGPIFSEYLYIRFYSGGGTEGVYWAREKFLEVLMQLQFNNVLPDEALIAKEYKNWWIPVAEEIIIENDDKQPGSKNKTTEKKTENSLEKDISPEVFISYQWGKQKQIQALYQRLTGLGYHCWMDIHQMGGGDSLYDKIDRGVRGCRVVLSSVTQKYALSANCRREVSLADALKKPVIPLLMEEIEWPPKGPMSMVFTQLLYINFCANPEIQMKWKGKEFDELLEKIRMHLYDQNIVGKTTNAKPASNRSQSNRAKPVSARARPQIQPTGHSTDNYSAIHGDSVTSPRKTPRQKESAVGVEHSQSNNDHGTQNQQVPHNTSQREDEPKSQNIANTNQNKNNAAPAQKSSSCRIL